MTHEASELVSPSALHSVARSLLYILLYTAWLEQDSKTAVVKSTAGSFVPDIDEALRIEVQLTRVIQVDASLGLPFHTYPEVL